MCPRPSVDEADLGIRCPRCGTETYVIETRDAIHGLRRRRQCRKDECLARFSTMEVAYPNTQKWDGKRMMLFPVAEFDALASAIGLLKEK